VPLSSALPFLQGALWGGGERRRAAAIARSLHRAEQVALLGELADARQRWGEGAAQGGSAADLESAGEHVDSCAQVFLKQGA
jgi:hypothetical protein